ncbi:MAG: hypothetical protein H6684_10030 [Deltaproteobacteria bacterium]|nr:hypothetical protein [Deltaproteobacteria bacterium]MCB9478781.1 hypothetical protein [Deltaproteobacteria bacterium]MCB9489057.1 hypothetical protein [Deltaproteobacteria bacterium]
MRSASRIVFAFVGVLILAVAVTVAASTPDVESMRARAAELVLKQAEMGWGSWVLGDASDQASLYEGYEDLFTKDAIAVTREAIANTNDPEKAKALTFFKQYQESEYLGAQTAMLADIQNDLEAELKVLVDGELIPYHNLDGRLANEKDPRKRAEMAKEEYRIYDLLNKVVLKRQLDESQRLARELGYANYLEMSASMKAVDVDKLAASCRAVLDRTQSLYFELFDKVSPIPRTEFRRSDILRVLGAKRYDEVYPKDKLLASMNNVLGGMGVDLHRQKNILVHDEMLPKKNPRAVCFPIRVPEDVRLSIKPHGGKDDFSALYHEMGHAQHFANSKTNVWEFQHLGSNAVTEGYAYVFEAVVEDPRFLHEQMDADDAVIKRLKQHSTFARLYMLRRYASKILYEVDLFRGAGEPQELYRKHLSAGYGFELTEDEATRALSDVDPFLYSADYYQAFFLEAMLRKYMTDNFGDPWWKQPAAMQFLKSLWAKGNELSGDELAEILGFTPLDMDLLFTDIQMGMDT